MSANHPALDPGFRRDPYPLYRRLQAQDPVHWSASLGAWVVTRYDDALSVLRDPHFSARRRPGSGAPAPHASLRDRMLLFHDPPEHDRLRRVVHRAFSTHAVSRLRHRVQTITDGLLERAARRGRMDWVKHVATPLPVAVIAELLGVPAADRGRFRSWSGAVAAALDPVRPGVDAGSAPAALAELSAYFGDVLAARRANAGDDLMGLLLRAQGEAAIDAQEVVAFCVLLLIAGHETTTHLLGTAVLSLLRHPGERERLARNPGLVESAVEEFLRFESPVQMRDRRVARSCELRGRRLREGERVFAVLGAANRDPDAFRRPDRLDLARRDNRHLAFGYGTHFCLGASLARLEARVALGALIRRFPSFKGEVDEPDWKPTYVLRGLASLPLRL